MQWKQDMPSYRPKPVSNETLNSFMEAIGLLTDIKPMFQISAPGQAEEYSQIAGIEQKIAKGWAKKYNFNRSMAFWTMFSMFTTAPAKLFWNPFANGDSGDPEDAEISMEVCPTSSLFRVGMGDNYQDDELLIYRRVRTLDWIKRAYPNMGKLVQPEEASAKYSVDSTAPVSVMPQLYSSLSPGMKRMMGGAEKMGVQSIYPKAEIREYWMKDDSVNESGNKIWMGPQGASWGYWVQPRQKLYPRGRLIVRANRVTLYDEPNPYFHRKKPFVPLAMYDVPWQQYALSVVKPWMGQNDILNQFMQGIIQCVKKAINPALMAPKNSIAPETLKAIDASKPNLKISYSGNAPTPPTWQNPPNVPAYVFQAYGIVQKNLKNLSAGAMMDEASGKKQIPGGDTLDRMTFSKTTPIRMMGRNIEESVDQLGNMWVGTSFQFHDAGRRVQLIGRAGLAKEDSDDRPNSLIPSGINAEQFVRLFAWETDKGTLLNVQRQDRIQIGFALRRNGDLSRKGIYRLLDWNIDQAQNDAELLEEAAVRGMVAPPPKGHK
jgi:hypothetical protein